MVRKAPLGAGADTSHPLPQQSDEVFKWRSGVPSHLHMLLGKLREIYPKEIKEIPTLDAYQGQILCFLTSPTLQNRGAGETKPAFTDLDEGMLMSIKGQSLSARLLLLALVGTLLMGSAIAYGVISLLNVLEVYDYALDHQVDNERQMLIMQSDFKKQVQEWKNVLLRGFDAKNLNKYWGKFEAQEASIKANGAKLLFRLEDDSAKRILRSFLTSHEQMGRAYRAGLEKFKQSGFDPKVGDKSVKGIDRAPTRKLAEAAENISQRLYQSTSHLRDQSHNALFVSLLVALVALVAMAGFTVWMLKRIIINPTKAISVSLKRFADGDFSKIDIEHQGGELGEVAESALQVKEHLGGIIREVRGAAVELIRAAGSLSETTHNTQDGLVRQQGDIQQVATAMDQMSAVVNQVSSNAQAAVEAARTADAASTEGRKIVETGIIEVRELAQDVEGAADVVQSLQGDVANIGSVLDVIKSIAEQTNLLALNAAIEAARAGEQGRGFAVVADEVRTLAGRTQESTSEIQQMIERLESGSGRAVKVMAESRQRVEVSVEHASKAGESLRQITDAVAAIAQMNEQIVASSSEQSTVTEEIHRNVTSINDLARHTGESARAASEAGEGVAALAGNMEALVGRFKV